MPSSINECLPFGKNEKGNEKYLSRKNFKITKGNTMCEIIIKQDL